MKRLGTAVYTAIGTLPAWTVKVDETRGSALVDISNINLVPGYYIGIQVQNRAIKIFCAPNPYSPNATPQTLARVTEIITQLRDAVAPTATISPTQSRGFRSFRVQPAPEGRNIALWSATVTAAFNQLLTAIEGMDE